jgi:hypothetical protein
MPGEKSQVRLRLYTIGNPMLVQRSYRGASPMQEVEKRAQLCGVRVFRARSLSRVWLVRVDPSRSGGASMVARGWARLGRRGGGCRVYLRYEHVSCVTCVSIGVCRLSRVWGSAGAAHVSRRMCVLCTVGVRRPTRDSDTAKNEETKTNRTRDTDTRAKLCSVAAGAERLRTRHQTRGGHGWWRAARRR